MNMKMLAEYLEHAIGFERMADETEDGPLKEQFQKQAEAYRKLAEKRGHSDRLPQTASTIATIASEQLKPPPAALYRHFLLGPILLGLALDRRRIRVLELQLRKPALHLSDMVHEGALE
jgi:hypothetical protein